MKGFGSSYNARGAFANKACKNAGLGEKYGSSDGVLKLMRGFFQAHSTSDHLNPNQFVVFAPDFMPAGCSMRFEEHFVEEGRIKFNDVNSWGNAEKIITEARHNLLKLTALNDDNQKAVLVLKFYHYASDAVTVMYSDDKDESGFTCGCEWNVSCIAKSDTQIAEEIKAMIRNPDLEMRPFKDVFDRLEVAKRGYQASAEIPGSTPAP